MSEAPAQKYYVNFYEAKSGKGYTGTLQLGKHLFRVGLFENEDAKYKQAFNGVLYKMTEEEAAAYLEYKESAKKGAPQAAKKSFTPRKPVSAAPKVATVGSTDTGFDF